MVSLCAVLAALGCQASPTGIRVEIGLPDGFNETVKTLRLTVTVTDGFKPAAPVPSDGATVSVDAGGNLVVVFSASTQPSQTFSNKLSFRIDTQNQIDLTITSAQALGFDGTNQKIASASATNIPLPKGDEGRLTLKLMSDMDGTNIDNTLLDLASAKLDRTVTGPPRPADLATVAVCNFEGNSKGGGDLVIGVPNADQSQAIMGTGAVYVVPHAGSDLDLGAGVGQEFHFFGVAEGDQLGASIACLDFDHDGADDLVVGAPGAYGATRQEHAGRVYILKGRSMVVNRTVDLSLHEAQIEFVGGAANAALGQRVLAAAVQGGDGEVLIAAPGEGGGAGVVHLVTIGHTFDTATTAIPKVLSGTAGHITFSGIRPEAMAVGDLDGNGATASGSEIILGDPGFNLSVNNTTMTGVGAVYIFHNVDPLAATAYSLTASDATGPSRVIQGTITNQALGAALLVLNVAGGSGPDLVVGVPGDSASRGAVWIYEHQNTFFTAPVEAKWQYAGASDGERFGTTLASGPANLPVGNTPLHIGAPEAASGTKPSAGAVYTFARTSAGARPTEVRPRLIGGAAKDRLGVALAAGPIDEGDNISDLVMLAPGVDGATSHPGVAYVRLAK